VIELRSDSLVFTFTQVHPKAKLQIEFQRTLRIPDDDRSYALPPGLGRFPLRHVDDFAAGVPRRWLEHGGVMLPMYQSEAMWLNFSSDYVPGRWAVYPFAIKVAAGKISAVSGEPWNNGLGREPQDYMVAPGQPWLDGYCVEKGVIRQFVAMPLGAGYTAEEQITRHGEHGGVQIVVYPMKRDVFERRFPRDRRVRRRQRLGAELCLAEAALGEPVRGLEMGLAPGGRMRQEIFEDPYELGDWDRAHGSRCYVHIANSLVWRMITGDAPPTTPPTAKEYTRAGLPWFEYYDESATPLDGSKVLGGLSSVAALGAQKEDVPLPENQPVDPANVVALRQGLARDQVREGRF
jgi:hypothetical protein